jgi:PAS domain S-box-containing protein
MPALAWSARPNGEADFFNEHYLKYVGLSSKQAEGWGWTAAVHPDDMAYLSGVWQGALASGAPTEAEARLRRYDGTYRWHLFRASPLRSENGEIVKWYGVNTDIEDRKSTEERLRESERQARLIVDTIPGQVAVLLPNGIIEAVNPQLVAYCGRDAEALQNWGSDGTVHPDDMPIIGPVFVRSLETGVPYEFECRIRRFDGVYRWFQVRGLPLRDPAGRISRWYSLLTDVDDRKQAEIELRQAYNSFADAQRLSKTGSFITDIIADDHNWSDEAYRIFEFDRGSKVSVLRIRDLVNPADLEHFDSVIARGAAGEPVDFDFRITTPSGTTKHIRGLAHVVERVAGRPLFVGALQDVTETRLAEEALNKTRSELAHVARVTALSTLTASIAHEVSQPLSGIMTNANTGLRMLIAEPPNVEGARKTLQRTLRDGNRASEIVARLRALFSKKSVAAETVHLSEAAREVIALSLGELQRNSVSVRAELAESLPPIVGDRVQLQQVILNLLLNASDAMRSVDTRPRRVTVKTDRDEDGNACLSVEDSGVGIDPEVASKLFDAFYTTKAGGMGIGLSVSRSIIERHGGKIWAAPNDGPGATFRFSIPSRLSGAADVIGQFVPDTRNVDLDQTARPPDDETSLGSNPS